MEKEPTKDPSCTPCEFDSGKTVGQMTSFQPHWYVEILGGALSGSLPLESSTQRTSALFAFENQVTNSKLEKGRTSDKVNQVFCTGELDRKELFHPLRISVNLFFQSTWKPQGYQQTRNKTMQNNAYANKNSLAIMEGDCFDLSLFASSFFLI